MSRTFSDSFTRSNGSLGSIPGGPAWQVLSGTWAVSGNTASTSTAVGSNPLAAVSIGKRSHGLNDMYVEATPSHVYGVSLYARVVDASNWIRAKVSTPTSSYQYYTTEYEYQARSWVDYYAGYDTQYQMQNRTLQRQVSYFNGTCTGSGFSNYTNSGSPTGCRTGAPTPPANQQDSYGCGLGTVQYRYVDIGASGTTPTCSGSQTHYQLQTRTQTVTKNYSTKWVNDGYSLGTDESFTGSTQYVNSGSTYYTTTNTSNGTTVIWTGATTEVYQGYVASVTSTQPNATSNPGQTTSTPTNTGYDRVAYGTTSLVTTGNYWSTSSVAPDNDLATNATRSAGPYTGTNYFYGTVTLEKCVAGTITQLANVQYSTLSPAKIRLTCVRDTLTVSRAGTTIITVTDGAFKSTGVMGGIGGGQTDYSNQSGAALDDFVIAGVAPERIRVGSAWVPLNRKVRSASGTWIDRV